MKSTLSFADYSRMHSVIEAVVTPFSNETHKSCLFFGIAGAALITRHLGIAARPQMGAALYCVHRDHNPDVLTFGKLDDDGLSSDDQAFHCWIDAGTHVIDLMAPLFPRMDMDEKIAASIPRRSFIRLKEDMATSAQLNAPGEFYYEPDDELTDALLRKNLARNDVKDLIDVCNYWFKPSPRTIPQTLAIGSNDGTSRTLRLRPANLDGEW